MSPNLDRRSVAARCALFACLSATALVLLPKGFAVYGALLMAISLLVPDQLPSNPCSRMR